MKSVMLLGITRSGKSTLANMIHEKYNYNIIHGDMIKASFQKNIKNLTSQELKNDLNYRKFIKDIFYNEIKYNKTNTIIDTVDIFPSDITLEDINNFNIYFLGYPNIEYEELVNIWKSTDLEFTKKFSDDDLISKAKRGIENSKKLKAECEKYNLKFIDTTYNREEILKSILDEIE